MKVLLLLLVLTGCAKTDCQEETVWYSRNGQMLTVGCGQLTYRRPMPSCYLSAPYEKEHGYNILWNLDKGSCFFKNSKHVLCYLNKYDYNVDKLELSCQEIGLHAIFERAK